MNLIGREKQSDELNQCMDSKFPEFIALYGRLGIGKTYLIREFFPAKFSFYSTGVQLKETKEN